MDDRKICFEKIKNARDLGGLAAADGKHIKSGLLIRCGHIGKASENDVKLLEKKYEAQQKEIEWRIKFIIMVVQKIMKNYGKKWRN